MLDYIAPLIQEYYISLYPTLYHNQTLYIKNVYRNLSIKVILQYAYFYLK